MNEAVGNSLNDEAQEHGYVEPHKRASTYREALTSLGFEFKRNLMQETIEFNGEDLDKFMLAGIRSELTEIGLRSRDLVKDSIDVLANDNSYHPIHDYFEGLEWDGKDHITSFLQSY